MKLTKSEAKRINKSIEKVSQFEEKLGVRLENISCSLTPPYFNVHGDFFMDDLDNFKNYSEIEIHATIYDEDNDILGTERTKIYKSRFLGFETFRIRVADIDPQEIKRIVVYLKSIEQW